MCAFRQQKIILHRLLQMPHPLWSGGGQNAWSNVAFDPEACVASDVFLQFRQPFIRPALTQIQREHPARRAAIERRMVKIVIEYRHIPRFGCQGHRRNLGARSLRNDLGQSLSVDVVEVMAARNDAQGTAVPVERIEVDRQLDETESAMLTVTMPGRVADIKITIAAEVGKILTEDLSDQGMQPWMVQE